MEHSYKFFENKNCKYFPCHKGIEDLNCIFCFCPLYNLEHCPGEPEYLKASGKSVKDCSKCTFPHLPESYEVIIQMLENN